MIILAGNRFFRIFGKIKSQIRNYFCLKPSPDQYGANKKRFSQIGPAVPELLRDTHTHTHTDRQTDKNPYYFVVLMIQRIIASFISVFFGGRIWSYFYPKTFRTQREIVLLNFSSLGLTVLKELGSKQANSLTSYCFRGLNDLNGFIYKDLRLITKIIS